MGCEQRSDDRQVEPGTRRAVQLHAALGSLHEHTAAAECSPSALDERGRMLVGDVDQREAGEATADRGVDRHDTASRRRPDARSHGSRGCDRKLADDHARSIAMLVDAGQGNAFPLTGWIAKRDLACMLSGGFPDGATARCIHAKVLRRLRSRLREPDASDLAGDVMLAFADYRGECKPETYAFSVMHRRLSDFHRQRLRRAPTVALDEVDELADEPDRPDLVLDLSAMVEHGLQGVHEVYRDVVTLRLLGLKAREIACELELSPNTTRSRLARGLGQFRARLDRQVGALEA
jgi:RNA polymerase sigma factor (sigma-70 family)